ncbi:alpha/beta hydrolase [Skermania piniformis]|uniref:Alpha/beta hydrolase n=1 Tax=Skermania pinensis TaxID=39122 RepID=A0ABX8SCY5_9ACTN|nr:alpha/beta hydrolase [Skermania piniformis]
MRLVPTSDGAALRVHIYGAADAPTVVLSHGWTCSIEFWYPQINALAERFRVVAYDQRGHGGSSVGRRRFGSDVLADDFAAVLAATVPPGKRAVLVGHSMGGMTIMAWAGRYPEQVRERAAGAVLANTGCDRLVAETTAVPFLPGAGAVRRAAGHALSAPVPLPRVRGVTDALRFVAMSPTATREQVEFCVRIVVACSGRIRGRWGTALHRIDLGDAVTNLAVPTVVFGGGRDRMTPAVHSERLADALRGAGHLDRLLLVPTSGHMGPVEAADQLNAEISRLAEAPPARRLRAVAG